MRGDHRQKAGGNDGRGTPIRTAIVSLAEQQKFRVPGTHLMGWLSEVLMRLPVENVSMLLGNLSSIAAKSSCVRSQCDMVPHSCGHSGEVSTDKACFVEGHHA